VAADDASAIHRVTGVQAQSLDEGAAARADSGLVPILVVDDSPAKRLALKAALQPLSYSIVEADSGVAALRCVAAEDFAVILLDVRMPSMDGFETAALIRQRKQSEMTPIIFFTAYSGDEIANADRYAEGAVDFMFAPVPPEEIRAKVSVFANLFIKAGVLAARAQDVQTSADQLRLLTDAAPIGIFQTDADNRYVYTNPRWTEITGIASERANGQAWDTMIGVELVPGHAPADTSTADELCRRFEIAVAGSTPRIVLATSKLVPGSGKGASGGWVGTLADVTAETGAEAALADARDAANESSRLKSDFLANMSHEIRTPMNGVIGMTDLLLETDLDARQRDYAQTVRNSGEALLSIIDDILDFSKVEAGKVDIEHIDIDLWDIVHGVVDLLSGSAQAKGLELVAVVERSVPSTVKGDPGRVRQVLMNLIGNAIKFTDSGEIVVRAAMDQTAGDFSLVRFRVSDTGAGIDPDKLDLIFQPFVQADTSTSRRHGGTGLGLAISGQLVALMGGDCGVSSVLGRGSTFWFTVRIDAAVVDDDALVLAGTDRAADSGLARATTGTDGLPSAGRLLLAEDNPINQKVAVAMLSGAGYTVDTVSDGAAAVAAAATGRYDVILMDCQMPELSGYEATAAIRAHEGAARHTPIVALTAGARREDRERCLAEGMDSYLAKPLNKDVLLALVATTVMSGPTTTDPLPVAHPAAAEVMIDPVVLSELIVLGQWAGQDFLADLVEQFTHETEQRLAELRAAFEAGDAEGVARVAHLVQGSACQLGGRRLAVSCDRLENKATTGLLAEAGPDLQGLDIDYQDLRRTLTQLMAPGDHRDLASPDA
jgi:PAS domain S-box-containing protein